LIIQRGTLNAVYFEVAQHRDLQQDVPSKTNATSPIMLHELKLCSYDGRSQYANTDILRKILLVDSTRSAVTSTSQIF